ncbi:MAG: hypothetical protein M0R66_03945 [Candidatus Omnitrophica bacterium]|nr:hypothetical protein [Candidatus Omnitrophota bacterium]
MAETEEKPSRKGRNYSFWAAEPIKGPAASDFIRGALAVRKVVEAEFVPVFLEVLKVVDDDDLKSRVKDFGKKVRNALENGGKLV